MIALVAAGCGAKNEAQPTTAPRPAQTAPHTTTATAAPSPSPLQAEANAAAAGDIPDNQVFLRFDNAKAGYSMKYPEGWARQGSGSTVTFRDKSNVVRIVVGPGGRQTAAGAGKDLAGVTESTVVRSPASLSLSGHPAVKATYATQSAPNPVTGKRVTLVVDRYYLWHGGQRAVVDLGTPRGVDNVDAYRLMIKSFTWR